MKNCRGNQMWRALGLTFLMALLSPHIYAAHPEVSLAGSDFEIDTDANLMVDDAAPSIDWEAVAADVQADEPSGSDDDAFGQGSKEDTPVPTPVTGSIPPNKSDLKTFGVYLEANASGRFLHMFWHRVQDPSGTTNMDFEFNQSDTLSANGVTPVRTADDLLIQYDLANGGTFPELFLSRWIDGSGGETSADCEASNKLPCWGTRENLSGSGDATGSINDSMILAADAIPKLGGSTLGDIDPRTFGEASIDFDAITSAGQCTTFGSAYLKSRSSNSFPAALKDYITPLAINVSNCGTVKINKVDDATPANPLAGAVFELRNDNTPFGGSPGAEDDLVTSCTTTASGFCTMTGILAGSYWVVETVAPAGHNLPTPPHQLVTVNIDSETSVTFIDPRKPATINIVKKDDAGAALQGAVFTLFNDDTPQNGSYDSGSDTSTGKSCTTNASGLCTISNILPPGDFCVVETTTPANYGTAAPQCFALALDQTKTLNFVDPRLRGAIKVTKTRKHAASGAGNHPHAGVTFTFSGGSIIGSPTAVTNASGVACLDNLVLSSLAGNYSVMESVPSGYVALSTNPQSVSITTAGTCGSGNEASVSFSNMPLTNISVSVDSQVVGGTASTINCGSAGSTSTGAGGDGALNMTNLQPGTYTCVIIVDP
ncbi:MAG: SpaA isopeptide-forming pilin-related protein [Porticoccus sp.]